MKYDVVVIGAGPGGYVAAIRSAQLGMRVAVVERENLGGVCLNWGCIPTKALLQSAHAFTAAQRAGEFGVMVGAPLVDVVRVVERSREVAATMSKGIQYLLNKNKVDIISGSGKLTGGGQVEVTDGEGKAQTIKGKHIIVATGARVREFPWLPIDGKRVIGYREALLLKEFPKSLSVVGSGAIGSELAEYFHSFGVEVTIIEAMDRLQPLEDDDVCKAIGRELRKAKIKTMVEASVQGVKVSEEGCVLRVKTRHGEEEVSSDMVLAAVGITPNVENLGLEELGVEMERGRIKVDSYFRTNVEGVYAVGDVVPSVSLAHVASAEAVCCVDAIAGLSPSPVDYSAIPSCTYTSPEVASIGLRERQAVEQGIEIVVGSYPFTASGKATAMGAREGFVKLIFRKVDHRLVGAHIIGAMATEIINELALALKQGMTAEQLHTTIHPHPTLGEGVMEAAGAALGSCVHL